MRAAYHRQALERAVGAHVSGRALAAITAANLGQDELRGLIGHPEYHFDDNAFAEGLAYIEANRALAARAESPAEAWAAFGRLSHAAQDFYSHSNYVALWLEKHGQASDPPPSDAIDDLDPTLLTDPRLVSAHVYLPLDALWFISPLRPLVRRLLPKDSHAWMNLDGPETGPLFPYSLEAAIRRTRTEYERTLAAIGETHDQAAVAAFRDLSR